LPSPRPNRTLGLRRRYGTLIVPRFVSAPPDASVIVFVSSVLLAPLPLAPADEPWTESITLPPLMGSLARRKSKCVSLGHDDAVVQPRSFDESATTVLPAVTRTERPTGERDLANDSVPIRCGPDGRWLSASGATVTDGVAVGTITGALSSTVRPLSRTTTQPDRHESRRVSA